jgi:hypothetical protein
MHDETTTKVEGLVSVAMHGYHMDISFFKLGYGYILCQFTDDVSELGVVWSNTSTVDP